jgi:hypothetical protein
MNVKLGKYLVSKQLGGLRSLLQAIISKLGPLLRCGTPFDSHSDHIAVPSTVPAIDTQMVLAHWCLMLTCRTLRPQETLWRDGSVGCCGDVTLHVMKVVVPFDTARTIGTPVREPQKQEDGHLASLFVLKTHCRRLFVSLSSYKQIPDCTTVLCRKATLRTLTAISYFICYISRLPTSSIRVRLMLFHC